MLNDYYYYTLICPYIDIKYRQICSRRDVHLIADKNPKKTIFERHDIFTYWDTVYSEVLYLSTFQSCRRYSCV